MATQKLSHRLIDLGFLCALGTFELEGVIGPSGHYIGTSNPNSWSSNNGAIGVWDEEGRPWVIRAEALPAGGISTLGKEYGLRSEGWVPHSNDGGNFLCRILPQLKKGQAVTVPAQAVAA